MNIPAATLDLLRDAIARGVTPGAALSVIDADGHLSTATLGLRRQGGESVTPLTRYDVASLTKVVVTLPLVLQLVHERAIDLADPVGRFFSNAGWFQTPTLADVPLHALLTHTSGLPAWRPLFAEVTGRRTALAAVLQTPLAHPFGTVVYSDLGFMLLGAIVERVTHMRLDLAMHQRLAGPLGLPHTRFGPLHGTPVAATEDCGWRGGIQEGAVHDENATVWDGVAGHAGLFATAPDLARYALAWLRRDPALVDPPLQTQATRSYAPGAHRGLGWMLPTPGSFAGDDARGFGHTGFTGTSLWIDPDRGVAVVLLTNRVHPHRGSAEGIHALRRAVHQSLWETL